jgi:hypothetical protein
MKSIAAKKIAPRLGMAALRRPASQDDASMFLPARDVAMRMGAEGGDAVPMANRIALGGQTWTPRSIRVGADS